MTPNPILTAGNAFRLVTNFAGSPSGVGNAATQNPGIQQFTGLPLGTAGDSATGEIAVKVLGIGGSFPSTQSVTLHTALLGASATQAIPTGAKGYLVAIITGTATVNGTASVPAGISLSDANTLAAGFSVVTDSASSAFVAWNT